MTRFTQSLLLIWAIVTLVLSAWTCSMVDDMSRARRADSTLVKRLATDNETIAMLRAEVARIKAEQHETEVALDKEAIENSRLRDEVRVLRLNEALDKARRSM